MAQDPVIADNKYIFWNSLGFAASQSQKGKKPVEENLFSFGPMSDLAAKAQSKPFTGELLVKGEVLTKNTSIDDVKKKIKKGRDVFGGWRVEFEGGPFYVDINPTEKGTGSVNVVQPLVNR